MLESKRACAEKELSVSNETIEVLLVEDNREYAAMLRYVFTELNPNQFELQHVTTLHDGLKKLALQTFDAILLDLSLPDSLGLNTFNEIYTHASTIPIVVMTALDDKDMALRAVRDGAQDYLVKGELDVNQLVRSLQYAVERNRTLSSLKQLSLIDELTGALNRRGFTSLARQHLKIAQRAGRELLLFFADVDGLKQINDHNGHQAGDQALRAITDILKDTFRSSDLIARLGGDEFTVMAINAPKENAETILARLQENVQAQNERNQPYQLSLSVGVARYDPQVDSTELDELLARADKDLYANKESKRTKASKSPESNQ
jgi:diguanylate cyclase (GGDEF)-like protein